MTPPVQPSVDINAARVPRSYYTHARQEMLKHLPEQLGTLLDVGCGDGAFGALVKARRPETVVWGVEPVAAAHAAAAAVLDHAVLGLFDSQLPLPQQHFDAISFNDSLEHFPDERAPLELARRLLKPGGRLVVSIPNVRCWTQVLQYLVDADWKYEEAGIMDRTHLRFFTRKSISRTLTRQGFGVDLIEGINPCWTGGKFKALRMLAPDLTVDMEYEQFAIRAHVLPPVDP